MGTLCLRPDWVSCAGMQGLALLALVVVAPSGSVQGITWNCEHCCPYVASRLKSPLRRPCFVLPSQSLRQWDLHQPARGKPRRLHVTRSTLQLSKNNTPTLPEPKPLDSPPSPCPLLWNCEASQPFPDLPLFGTANQAPTLPLLWNCISPYAPPNPLLQPRPLVYSPVHQASSGRSPPPHPTGHPSKNAIFLVFSVRVRNDKNTTHVAKFAPSLGPVRLPPTPPRNRSGTPPRALAPPSQPFPDPQTARGKPRRTHEINTPTFEKQHTYPSGTEALGFPPSPLPPPVELPSKPTLPCTCPSLEQPTKPQPSLKTAIQPPTPPQPSPATKALGQPPFSSFFLYAKRCEICSVPGARAPTTYPPGTEALGPPPSPCPAKPTLPRQTATATRLQLSKNNTPTLPEPLGSPPSPCPLLWNCQASQPFPGLAPLWNSQPSPNPSLELPSSPYPPPPVGTPPPERVGVLFFESWRVDLLVLVWVRKGSWRGKGSDGLLGSSTGGGKGSGGNPKASVLEGQVCYFSKVGAEPKPLNPPPRSPCPAKPTLP